MYLQFSDWFQTKRTSVWFKINRKTVNTIWFRLWSYNRNEVSNPLWSVRWSEINASYSCMIAPVKPSVLKANNVAYFIVSTNTLPHLFTNALTLKSRHLHARKTTEVKTLNLHSLKSSIFFWKQRQLILLFAPIHCNTCSPTLSRSNLGTFVLQKLLKFTQKIFTLQNFSVLKANNVAYFFVRPHTLQHLFNALTPKSRHLRTAKTTSI